MAPHFLTIPAELRLEIYKHAYPGTDITIEPKPYAFPLLFVCRKVYNEAIEILYGSNQFVFEDGRALFNYRNGDPRSVLGWLHHIGRSNRTLIKRVAIDWLNLHDYWGYRCDDEIYKLVCSRDRAAGAADAHGEMYFDAQIAALVDKHLNYFCATASLLSLDCSKLRELYILVPAFHKYFSEGELSYFAPTELLSSSGPLQDKRFRSTLTLIQGLDVFTIGITENLAAAEELGREMGVKELRVLWGLHDHIVMGWEDYVHLGPTEAAIIKRWAKLRDRWRKEGWEMQPVWPKGEPFKATKFLR